MSNLPTSFCIDIVAEKEHKRLQEFKDWYQAQDKKGSYGFGLKYYGMSAGILYAHDKPFGEPLTINKFFSLLDPKPYTISDLANGVCAVVNDGTVEDLRKVLKAAFPFSPFNATGNFTLYYRSTKDDGSWGTSDHLDMPTQSVKLFLAELEKPEPIKANQYGVLPENWRVKPKTHEQYMTLAKWRGSEPKSNWENVWMLSLKTWVTDDYINMVYHTEITFEQFKKHVMNKPEPITSINVGDEAKQFDNVNKPKHYTSGKVECIDAIESAISELKGMDAFCTGNAIKYSWRWKQKNGIEDLEKAVWYINKLIELNTK